MTVRRPRLPLVARAVLAPVVALTLATAGLAATPRPVAATWERTLSVGFLQSSTVGDGRGRVTSDDGGIDCSYNAGATSGDCSEHYVLPNFQTYYDVTLTFDPDATSIACTAGAGGCAAAAQNAALPIHFDLGSGGNISVTGSFTLRTWRIQVDLSGPGSVSSGGTACTPSGIYDYCRDFKHGTTATLTPVPDPGSVFTYWTGTACDPMSGTLCSFVVDSNETFQAVFGKVRVWGDIVGEGDVCGTAGVTFCTEGDQLIPPVSQFIALGTTVVIEARPLPGWRFDHWSSGPCGSKPATCEFVVTTETYLTATFTKLATPSPSARPTTAATPKPTSGPGASTPPLATSRPAASGAAPSATPSAPAPGGSSPGDPATSSDPSPYPEGTANDTPSFDAGATASPTDASSAASPAPSAVPVSSPPSGGAPDLTLILVLFLAAAVLVVVLGFGLGRRGRAPTNRAG